MERVAIYLRKSRQDLEAETRGEGETLAKHRKTLLKVAQDSGLNIINIREEIVSGESLINRPEMLELLKEVENGLYEAVLVMDVDRLGRGNMQEQGLIQETFKTSNTKIITPRKVYDLNDEWDEEYSEFEQFMARKELKIINRRLQRGRLASVREGNYIGNKPPYGYQKKTLPDGSLTLEPHPEQASIVKLIFEMYTKENIGCGTIARKLMAMNVSTQTGSNWIVATIRDILQNETYTGMIRWDRRKTVKQKGSSVLSRPRAEDYTIVKGKHEPLIDEKIFKHAQEIFASKAHVPTPRGKISNPLAGLVRCGKCNASMVLRPYSRQPAHIICSNQFCTNKSARFSYVEEKLLSGLEEWINEYKLETEKHKPAAPKQNNSAEAKKSALKGLEKDLADFHTQKGNLHKLVELGAYTIDVYLERSNALAVQVTKMEEAISRLRNEIAEEVKRDRSQREIVPRIKKIIDGYHRTDDPAKKNALLKSILHYAVYTKEKHQRLDDFTMTLKPKLTLG